MTRRVTAPALNSPSARHGRLLFGCTLARRQTLARSALARLSNLFVANRHGRLPLGRQLTLEHRGISHVRCHLFTLNKTTWLHCCTLATTLMRLILWCRVISLMYILLISIDMLRDSLNSGTSRALTAAAPLYAFAHTPPTPTCHTPPTTTTFIPSSTYAARHHYHSATPTPVPPARATPRVRGAAHHHAPAAAYARHTFPPLARLPLPPAQPSLRTAYATTHGPSTAPLPPHALPNTTAPCYLAPAPACSRGSSDRAYV